MSFLIKVSLNEVCVFCLVCFCLCLLSLCFRVPTDDTSECYTLRRLVSCIVLLVCLFLLLSVCGVENQTYVCCVERDLITLA